MRRLREWVLERYPGPEHERLRQHVQLWMGQLAVGLGADPALVENIWRLEEGAVLIAAAEEKRRRVRAEGRAEGRTEGHAEGRAQFRAEIAAVIRNGGTAAEALARAEEMVNGGGEAGESS